MKNIKEMLIETNLGSINPKIKAGSGVPAMALCHGEVLSPLEQNQFERCERILSKGLSTFFEVGAALLTIRESGLYRCQYHSFEAYCHERWGMGRSYAWRLIGAAERLKLLPNRGEIPRPTNEFQIRPFLRLEPEAFPKAWEEAVARAKNGVVTSALLRRVIAQIIPQRRGTTKPVKTAKRIRLPKYWSPGQMLVLLDETRQRVKKGEVEKALESLDNIEVALFGPSLSLLNERRPARSKEESGRLGNQ
jgi:hypothetical protein